MPAPAISNFGAVKISAFDVLAEGRPEANLVLIWFTAALESTMKWPVLPFTFTFAVGTPLFCPRTAPVIVIGIGWVFSAQAAAAGKAAIRPTAAHAAAVMERFIERLSPGSYGSPAPRPGVRLNLCIQGRQPVFCQGKAR